MTAVEWAQIAGSVGGAIGAFYVAFKAAVAPFIAQRKAAMREAEKEPVAPAALAPDAATLSPLDLLRERVVLLETQLRVANAQAEDRLARIGERDKEYERQAAALTAEREENQRLRTYVLELEQRRRETDSGYTRIATSYPPTVTEIDARPTPPRGTRRSK